MRKLILAALLVTTSAMASEVSFTVGGRGGMNTTFYNCNAVESVVKSHIENLGGSNVSVRCTGGLDIWGNMPPMPAFVRASFDNFPSGNGPVEQMTLRSRRLDSCELNVTTLDAILPKFENITVLNKRNRCMNNRTRWFYDLEITR